MVGETSALDQNIFQSMRVSGISHILAVSGLHLSLVSGICFVIFRFLFNLIPYTAYYTDVKQIASLFALLGSFVYLLISGMHVAAIRAFIMTSLVIISIMLQRSPSPMRSVVFAAFLILLIYPEFATHPSFHLSFIAVISLLAGYELYSKYFSFSNHNMLHLLKIYIFSNIYSTIIASLATAPFVIYHFYIYSNYAIFANLIAVPITSFIIMPAAIFSFCAMPFHLEWLPLKIVAFGIKYIIIVARYIEQLPYSTWYFGHISVEYLIIYSVGFLLLCFLKTKLRFLGLVPIVFSIIMMLNTQKPDIIMTSQYIAINNNGTLEISQNTNKFYKNYWTGWFGQEHITIMKDTEYWVKDKLIKIIFEEEDVKKYLDPKYYLIINMTIKPYEGDSRILNSSIIQDVELFFLDNLD